MHGSNEKCPGERNEENKSLPCESSQPHQLIVKTDMKTGHQNPNCSAYCVLGVVFSAFTWKSSSHFYNYSVQEVLLLFPFYKGRNYRKKGSSKMPKTTKQVGDRAGIQIQRAWLLSPCLNLQAIAHQIGGRKVF